MLSSLNSELSSQIDSFIKSTREIKFIALSNAPSSKSFPLNDIDGFLLYNFLFLTKIAVHWYELSESASSCQL